MSRNPLVTVPDRPAVLPRNLTPQELEAEAARQARRTTGLIQNRSGTFVIDPELERIRIGSATEPLSGTGVFLGLDDPDYEFRVGDPAGAYMHWDGSTLSITNATLSPAPVSSSPGVLGWGHDLAFSSLDADTVQWGSGTLTLSDGTSYSISAGNTGNMVATTYVFLDTDVSSTVLQTTTTASSAVGTNKILVAVAKNSAEAPSEFQVYGGSGSVGVSKLITANEIAAGTITANELAANSVNTSELVAGAVTATEINVSSLSAISADLGSVTAGNIVVGTTNKLWLNDAADGALNIGGATKASAPFRVTNAGALTATDATITGTLTASSVVSANDFDGTAPVFQESVTVEAGDGADRVQLSATSGHGTIILYSGAYQVASIRGIYNLLGSLGALNFVAQGQFMNFSGPTAGTIPPAILLNNGDRFGPLDYDSSSAGTGASTSTTDLHSHTWPGDGTFAGAVVEFFGEITGTNNTKVGRVVIGGTSLIMFTMAAGLTGDWYARVVVSPISTSSQRIAVFVHRPDGTTTTFSNTSAINTLTTDYIIKSQGQTNNASDEVTCVLSQSNSHCVGG